MRLRRELAISFAVQGAGAASVLLATLWLGAVCGPQVQGGFSRAKSELEFVGALATFGLPQALFFHVRSGRMSLATALRWAGCCALLALPIGAVAAGLFDRSAAWPLVAASALAVGGFVAHGQLRALLLVHERATRFNFATAVPQWLTLVGVGASIGFAGPLALNRMAGPGAVDLGATLGVAGGAGAASVASAAGAVSATSAAGAAGAVALPFGWFAVFCIAYGATAAYAWRGLRGAAVASAAGTATAGAPTAGAASPATGGSLLRYGLAAWLTAVLATAAILGVQRWVEDAAGRAALGRFTMAMTWAQVPLTPIAYAAPLLFRRWIHAPSSGAAQRWSAGLFGVLLVVAAAIGTAAFWRDDLGLGPAYAGATLALSLLLVGGAAEAASRVLAVQANAAGLPWVAVRAEAARGSVLIVAWAALPTSLGLLAICGVWAAAAAAAAAVLVGYGRPGAAAC